MNFIISSSKQNIMIDSDAHLYDYLKTSGFAKSYISDFCIELRANLDLMKLEVVDSDTLCFKGTGDGYKLECNVMKNISYEDIVTVIDYCLDLVRAKDSIYCLHGSAVYKDGLGILLIGSASGLGKTTIALKLIEKYGFKLIGDDKVLINQDGYLIGGSKKLRFNKPILKQVFKDSDKFSNVLNSPETYQKITHIFQPVTSLNGELYIEEWEALKTEFHLYEELTRKIRGISRRINNYSYALQSLDNDKLASSRVVLSKLLSQIPASTVYGDPDKVVNFIANK